MYYMPRSYQHFSYSESPHEYLSPLEYPPLNSSFNSDPSFSHTSVLGANTNSNRQEDEQLLIDVITSDMIKEAKSRSNSRSNFATNLVRQLFDEDTRVKSNIAGLCNKDKLDTKKIAAVKKATFQFYPLGYGENDLVAWKKCHIVIDESCRRLNKKK